MDPGTLTPLFASAHIKTIFCRAYGSGITPATPATARGVSGAGFLFYFWPVVWTIPSVGYGQYFYNQAEVSLPFASAFSRLTMATLVRRTDQYCPPGRRAVHHSLHLQVRSWRVFPHFIRQAHRGVSRNGYSKRMR